MKLIYEVLEPKHCGGKLISRHDNVTDALRVPKPCIKDGCERIFCGGNEIRLINRNEVEKYIWKNIKKEKRAKLLGKRCILVGTNMSPPWQQLQYINIYTIQEIFDEIKKNEKSV